MQYASVFAPVNKSVMGKRRIQYGLYREDKSGGCGGVACKKFGNEGECRCMRKIRAGEKH